MAPASAGPCWCRGGSGRSRWGAWRWGCSTLAVRHRGGQGPGWDATGCSVGCGVVLGARVASAPAFGGRRARWTLQPTSDEEGFRTCNGKNPCAPDGRFGRSFDLWGRPSVCWNLPRGTGAALELGPPLILSAGARAGGATLGRPEVTNEDLCFSPDERTIASCGRRFSGPADEIGSNHVTLWDLQTAGARDILVANRAGGAGTLVLFSPDGGTLFFGLSTPDGGGFYDGAIQAWDVASCRWMRTLDWPNTVVTSLAISGDGALLAVGGWSAGRKNLRVWGVRSGKDRVVLEGCRINSLAFSPGDIFLAASSSDGVAGLWRVGDWSRVDVVRASGPYCGVAVSPSLKRPLLATTVGEWSSDVAIWSLPDRHQISVLKGGKRCIGCMGFSPDGRFLATGASNAGVRRLCLVRRGWARPARLTAPHRW